MPIECPVCNTRFPTLEELGNHRRRVKDMINCREYQDHLQIVLFVGAASVAAWAGAAALANLQRSFEEEGGSVTFVAPSSVHEISMKLISSMESVAATAAEVVNLQYSFEEEDDAATFVASTVLEMSMKLISSMESARTRVFGQGRARHLT